MKILGTDLKDKLRIKQWHETQRHN